MNTERQQQWTKPFFGVQHLGNAAPRVTVTNYGSFASLHCYYPGCGFRPLESQHDSAEQARAAGEQWLASQQVGSAA